MTFICFTAFVLCVAEARDTPEGSMREHLEHPGVDFVGASLPPRWWFWFLGRSLDNTPALLKIMEAKQQVARVWTTCARS